MFHFDITDASRTPLNPEPPDEPFAAIRFPTVAAFFDALVDTQYELLVPFYHMSFSQHLRCLAVRSYLSLYTLSDKGNHFIDGHADANERVLLPQFSKWWTRLKKGAGRS
ncbi:hypothetical protein DFH07DRAFT_278310 [Mycena maculata]|uniref:Uncharacterized protein n=1 Tax=Mycena maculata TaxID=230809 RepID=A0AAD7HLN0_9AGAR|nr:hypothetical protein DFH07DRAFT_278310 [Mycena maculata]